MSSGVTIHGGSGSGAINFSFTAYGGNTAAYANQFASAVNTLLTSENTTAVTPVGGQGSDFNLGSHNIPGAAIPVDVLQPDTTGSGLDTYLIVSTTPAWVVDTIAGVHEVDMYGSDSIIVAGTNPGAVVNANGSNNEIIFISGNNTFNAASTDTGGDTIVTGSGTDLVNTGTGDSSVIGGTGLATIYLNDTGSGQTNDIVWSNEGRAMVFANGTGDVVVASAAGQTVIGAAGATSTDVMTVILNTGADQSIVDGGGAYSNVFDSSNNDTINGGSYYMQVFAGANITGTVNAGDGSVVLFGNAGDVLQVGTQYGDNGVTTFIAGGGNETLYGAAATSNLYMFGGNDTAGSDLLVGGSGNDWINAGTGSETLLGGAGSNVFELDSTAAAGGNITIGDFNTNDTLAFSGYSASDVANAIASGTETTDGSFVITFGSSNTTITLTNTTASELTGHIVTFGS